MKKINLMLFLLVVLAGLVIPQAADQTGKPKEPIKLEISLTYVYTDEQKLLNWTDLHGSYFIRKKMDIAMKITGSEEMELGKTEYSDNDRMYVNKGSIDGVKDGDIYEVVQEGPKEDNRLTGKTMGNHYFLKSLARVVCTYEDKCVIVLEKGCHPVNIGDQLIPYVEQEILIARKPDYQLCLIPDSVKGNIVFSSAYIEHYRQTLGMEEYATIDLGKAQVSQGDILLIYRHIRPDLPPLILGTCIVIWSENTNATVKILECIQPVEIGFNVALLEEASEVRPSPRPQEDESIPLIEKAEQKTTDTETGEESLVVDILFAIDSANIKESDQPELDKIGDFIASKSQYVIILRGYSCSIGGWEHNLKLSNDRTENIKKYLMDKFKIDAKMFEAYHYGEKDAVYDNSTESERRKNRRVNIQVMAK